MERQKIGEVVRANIADYEKQRGQCLPVLTWACGHRACVPPFGFPTTPDAAAFVAATTVCRECAAWANLARRDRKSCFAGIVVYAGGQS